MQKIEADFAHQGLRVLCEQLRECGQIIGTGLSSKPRVDADGAVGIGRTQSEHRRPIGAAGGGHDKAAHVCRAGGGQHLGQLRQQGGVGQVAVGVGEHGRIVGQMPSEQQQFAGHKKAHSPKPCAFFH